MTRVLQVVSVLACLAVLSSCHSGHSGHQQGNTPATQSPSPPGPDSSTSSPSSPPPPASPPAGITTAASSLQGTYTGRPTSVLAIRFSSDAHSVANFVVTGSWICSTLGLEAFSYTVPADLPLNPAGTFTGNGRSAVGAGEVDWSVSGQLTSAGTAAGTMSITLGSACGIEPDTPWTAQRG